MTHDMKRKLKAVCGLLATTFLTMALAELVFMLALCKPWLAGAALNKVYVVFIHIGCFYVWMYGCYWLVERFTPWFRELGISFRTDKTKKGE